MKSVQVLRYVGNTWTIKNENFSTGYFECTCTQTRGVKG
jgi:hypothetical protein